MDQSGGGGDPERRLVELEMRFAHQEATIAELSSELYNLSRRLERVEDLARGMAGKLKDLADSQEPQAPGDVRPPHW